MSSPGYRPYQPQSQPLQLDENLWIVDGPEVRYRLAGLTLPCPTRMTVIRIGGALWLHSPCNFSAALAAQLAALGEVRWIIAPNSFHYTHIADWAAANPSAECHLSPDLLPRFTTLPSLAHALGDAAPAAWAEEIDQIQIDLGGFIESIFFHRSTSTVIVTDLMQNFEADRVVNPITRLILRAGGSIGPGGKTSVDIRLPARRYRDRVRTAAAQMLAWTPKRIILSHGKCYDANIPAEINRAFRWATG